MGLGVEPLIFRIYVFGFRQFKLGRQGGFVIDCLEGSDGADFHSRFNMLVLAWGKKRFRCW